MKRLTVMMVGVLLFGTAGAAAEKEWSSWQATDDPLIQWRFYIETYDKYISPDCVFQFQRTDDNEASFNYLVSYEPPSGSTSQRRGAAYGITSSEHGGDVISGCRGITHIAVSAVRTKTAGRADAPKNSQSVIEFPGKKAPLVDLTGVWRRDDGELVSITKNGDMVTARKLTGDQAVPANEISWEGEYSSNSFSGRGQRGSTRTAQRSWVPVRIVVQDANTIHVLGFNPDRTYRRNNGQ